MAVISHIKTRFETYSFIISDWTFGSHFKVFKLRFRPTSFSSAYTGNLARWKYSFKFNDVNLIRILGVVNPVAEIFDSSRKNFSRLFLFVNSKIVISA